MDQNSASSEQDEFRSMYGLSPCKMQRIKLGVADNVAAVYMCRGYNISGHPMAKKK